MGKTLVYDNNTLTVQQFKSNLKHIGYGSGTTKAWYRKFKTIIIKEDNKYLFLSVAQDYISKIADKAGIDYELITFDSIIDKINSNPDVYLVSTRSAIVLGLKLKVENGLYIFSKKVLLWSRKNIYNLLTNYDQIIKYQYSLCDKINLIDFKKLNLYSDDMIGKIFLSEPVINRLKKLSNSYDFNFKLIPKLSHRVLRLCNDIIREINNPARMTLEVILDDRPNEKYKYQINIDNIFTLIINSNGVTLRIIGLKLENNNYKKIKQFIRMINLLEHNGKLNDVMYQLHAIKLSY